MDTNLIEDLRRLAPPDYRWLAVLVSVLGLLLVGVWLWRRFRGASPKVGAVNAEVPGRAPWETALAELERLTALLRPEASREYGIAATAIVRTYIEQRYGLQAPRLATEEFLRAASRAAELPPEHRPHLERFLEHCDLFKFGRYQASAGELGDLHAAAIQFVMASAAPAATAVKHVEGPTRVPSEPSISSRA
jgi:hypothetical protein